MRPWLPMIAVLSGIASPAMAETIPNCARPQLGATQCLSGRLCACIRDPGGAVTGTPAGYRWDCGILRPRCGEAANPPASAIEYRGQPPSMPLAVGIDRSNRGVIVAPPLP